MSARLQSAGKWPLLFWREFLEWHKCSLSMLDEQGALFCALKKFIQEKSANAETQEVL
jgi:muconolactone delta-isomerase